MADKLSIIIPAYNEAKNLPKTIGTMRNILKNYGLEIIVVDDGSTDNTKEVAERLNIKVISYSPNAGKGKAFRKAIPYITNDYVVQIDADLQFQPYDIPRMIESLKKGNDIVLGSRFKDGKIEKGSLSKINRFGNWVMSIATSIASSHRVYDIMAGFKAFKTKALKLLDLKTDHFGYEAEIVVKAAGLGLKMDEIPITYRQRIDGTSNVKKLEDGAKVLGTIIKTKYARKK